MRGKSWRVPWELRQWDGIKSLFKTNLSGLSCKLHTWLWNVSYCCWLYHVNPLASNDIACIVMFKILYVIYSWLYTATFKFWSAADYTGYLILAPEICTVYRATDWTISNTSSGTLLVHTTTSCTMVVCTTTGCTALVRTATSCSVVFHTSADCTVLAHTTPSHTVLVHIATSCTLLVCTTVDCIALVCTAVTRAVFIICRHLSVWLLLLYFKDPSHSQLCET